MEMKHYIVKKRKKDWAVIEETEGLISKHYVEYDAWKEARRLARGAGGKATLNGNVMNIYNHDDI